MVVAGSCGREGGLVPPSSPPFFSAAAGESEEGRGEVESETKYFSQDPRGGIGVIHFQPLDNNNALSLGEEVRGKILWRGDRGASWGLGVGLKQ